jgi:hypothetical protein
VKPDTAFLVGLGGEMRVMHKKDFNDELKKPTATIFFDSAGKRKCQTRLDIFNSGHKSSQHCPGDSSCRGVRGVALGLHISWRKRGPKIMSDTTSQVSDAQQTSPLIGAQRKRRLWPVILILLLIAVVVFALLRNGRSKPQAASPGDGPTQAPNIKTATVRQGSIGRFIEALGTVTPLATVNLYSQVNGEVTAGHYTEGQIVNRGDALIDIDPRPKKRNSYSIRERSNAIRRFSSSRKSTWPVVKKPPNRQSRSTTDL